MRSPLEMGRSQEPPVPTINIEDVRDLNRLREEVRLQERKIQDWISAQIPQELLQVSDVPLCAGNLARTGGAGFMISKDSVEKYLGGQEATKTLLTELQERLQSIAKVEITKDPNFNDFQVMLSLQK